MLWFTDWYIEFPVALLDMSYCITLAPAVRGQGAQCYIISWGRRISAIICRQMYSGWRCGYSIQYVIVSEHVITENDKRLIYCLFIFRRIFCLLDHLLFFGVPKKTALGWASECFFQSATDQLQWQSFSAAGPQVWNHLLTDLTQPDLPYSRFRRSLETFLIVNSHCTLVLLTKYYLVSRWIHLLTKYYLVSRTKVQCESTPPPHLTAL